MQKPSEWKLMSPVHLHESEGTASSLTSTPVTGSSQITLAESSMLRLVPVFVFISGYICCSNQLACKAIANEVKCIFKQLNYTIYFVINRKCKEMREIIPYALQHGILHYATTVSSIFCNQLFFLYNALFHFLCFLPQIYSIETCMT